MTNEYGEPVPAFSVGDRFRTLGSKRILVIYRIRLHEEKPVYDIELREYGRDKPLGVSTITELGLVSHLWNLREQGINARISKRE